MKLPQSLLTEKSQISTMPESFEEIKQRFECNVTHFVRANAVQLLTEADRDVLSEVPRIPTLDGYLNSLEAEIGQAMQHAGLSTQSVADIKKSYEHLFYYTLLPALTYEQVIPK